MTWERPSERVRELLRQGANMIVSGSEEWLDELHEAALGSEYMRAFADDSVLADAMRRSTRSNLLYWAAANISQPGEPVSANPEAESLAMVGDAIGRGLDETAALDGARMGQNAAWLTWMQIAFTLTSDLGELRQLLDVSARSIGAFVDATVAGVRHQMQMQRDTITRGTHAERREIVTQIIDGAPITPQYAASRLGYRLEQSHTAAVIWGDESSTNLADLDRAAEALVHTGEARQSLSVLVSTTTRWVWLSGDAGPDLAGVEAAVRRLPGVRIAAGPTAAGIEGFRRSHLDAITTRRIMARVGSAQRVVSFADVKLIALITADPERTDRFIKQTLGVFESADPELHQTVLTFIREQCNASRAAERLFIHRNTLLNRLARANELLPQPLAGASVDVAVALEALRWHVGVP